MKQPGSHSGSLLGSNGGLKGGGVSWFCYKCVVDSYKTEKAFWGAESESLLCHLKKMERSGKIKKKAKLKNGQ